MNKIRKTDSDRFYDRIAKLLVEARSSVVQAINLFDGGFGYKFFFGEKTCLISKVGYNYFMNKEWLWLSSDTNSWNPEPDTYRWFYLKRQSITFSIGLMF